MMSRWWMRAVLLRLSRLRGAALRGAALRGAALRGAALLLLLQHALHGLSPRHRALMIIVCAPTPNIALTTTGSRRIVVAISGEFAPLECSRSSVQIARATIKSHIWIRIIFRIKCGTS